MFYLCNFRILRYQKQSCLSYACTKVILIFMIKCPLVQKKKIKKKIANAAKAMTLIIRSLDFGSGRTVF